VKDPHFQLMLIAAQAAISIIGHPERIWEKRDKPRARFNNAGVGYWTVGSFGKKGWFLQGVGLTLSEAYGNWERML